MARTPLLILCLLALAGAACGGGGEAEPARDVPTLTDPASVPVADPSEDRTPFVIGEDTVSEPGGGSIDRAPLPGAASRYTVAEGDTCGGIADAFGISVADLLNENPLIDESCTNLAIGWQLRIPAGAATSSGGGGGSTVGGTVYIVVEGDTCSDIAAARDVPLSTFLAVNGLTDESCANLAIGQQLRIPEGAAVTDGGDGGGSTAGGTVYTVVGGDTCLDIATAHDVPLSTFLAINGLTDESCTNLSIGQEVTIPR